MLTNILYVKNEKFGTPNRDLTPGDYDHVCDLQTIEDDYLDGIFREMNAVDGTETCCRLRLRSMSVGDVVVTPKEVWRCEPFGWANVPELAPAFQAMAAECNYK